MKNISRLFALLLTILINSTSSAQVKMNFKFDTDYGSNENTGKFVNINGTKIYFEEYGKGEPLLLIHGNGGSIIWMGNQIDYFKEKYRVIIADNRGQGKSQMNTDSLTYDQIAKDWEGLAKHLKLDSLSIVGWSDGGIVGLKMGINNKIKIKKIVAMGANLRPDSTAVKSWAINYLEKEKHHILLKIKEKDTTKNWNVQKQLLGLLQDQPNIPKEDLSQIKAEVLVIAGDEDIIKSNHSLEIYEGLNHAHLSIMPGETHFTPSSNPKLFNVIVNKFLSDPFLRPDSDFTKW
ncbi:alpha/beta fold hydrolase [Kriegella sp. EG-1]|nr:alpha/beta fold hydrolase [Flavobacteriaceae bacterium EG-1]